VSKAIDSHEGRGSTMSRSDRFAPTTTVEYVIPELEHLLAIAQQELDSHLSEHGVCCRCHERWPCATACLAAETLSAL
jgi:hypothetical protein